MNKNINNIYTHRQNLNECNGYVFLSNTGYHIVINQNLDEKLIQSLINIQIDKINLTNASNYIF